MDQTETISGPGVGKGAVRKPWSPFIHTHHYEVHGSFYEPWIANHPRRTLEPSSTSTWTRSSSRTTPSPKPSPPIPELVVWFEPLFEAERRHMRALEAEGA